ncbi:Nudix family hydrolase [Aestuariirhabdus sp. Z084]|nr:Nudix family hydrolase [Aestuariirhabdus haliotis]MCL6419899.1 Nudix family hydrolase [Aestuariirhabdus haliotis]
MHIVVGALKNHLGEVLIAKRPDDTHLGGYWELPGGKVEPGETAELALSRELAEELGVVVRSLTPLIRIHHRYPDRHILLDAYLIDEFEGVPLGCEGQPVRWVARNELAQIDFPAANRALNMALRLPDTYLISGHFNTGDELLARVTKAIDDGVRLIQFRAPWLAAEDYTAQLQPLVSICHQAEVQLMLKGKPDLFERFPGCGLHLTSEQLFDPAIAVWAAQSDRKPLLAASCHNVRELEQAAKLAVDFATLSPVEPTSSHPGQPGIGWESATALVGQASMPVYLLGGMGRSDHGRAIASGAQGIAAITDLW